MWWVVFGLGVVAASIGTGLGIGSLTNGWWLLSIANGLTAASGITTASVAIWNLTEDE